MPLARTRSSSSSSAVLDRGERRAVGGRRRQRVEERLLGRQQRAETPTTRGRARPARDTAARCAAAAARGSSTTGSRPSRRSAPRRGPAAGRKSGRSPPARDTPTFRYAVVPSLSNRQRGARRVCSGSTVRMRAGGVAGWNAAEVVLDAAQRLVGVDVADDDERRVVGDVVAAVVAVQIVARHRLQIRQPADRRMAVRMRLERGRGQLLIEQLIGIVLAALQLRDDDRALRLAVVGIDRGSSPCARPR